MGADNILPRGIKVMLAGEEKTLRFTMKSMAVLAEKYGTVTEVLNMFTIMLKGILTLKELNAMADLVSASLIHNDKLMTPEYISDTYDISDIKDIMPNIIEAFLSSMGTKQNDKESEKNPQKV